MRKRYLIRKVEGKEDSTCGEIVAVYANVVENDMVSELINSRTKIFLIPDDNSIVIPILNIAKAEQIWEPCLDDYYEDSIYLEDYDYPTKVYRHRKFLKKKGFFAWIKRIFNKN